MIPTYRVLTTRSTRECESEKDLISIIDEQEDILQTRGIDCYTLYLLHRFESPFTDDMTEGEYISTYTEATAQKEGLDLVEFENGNIGYIGYNGTELDGFEILGEYED